MANHHKSIIFHLLFLIAVVSCKLEDPVGKPKVVDQKDFAVAKDILNLKAALSAGNAVAVMKLLAQRSEVQRLDIASAYIPGAPNAIVVDTETKLKDGHSKQLLRAMMSPLPEYYASELDAAIPRATGGDISPIVDILFASSDEGIKLIDKAYNEMYGKSIEAALPHGDLRNFVLARYMSKRDESANVDSDQATADAAAIIAEDVAKWNRPDSHLITILLTRNYQHLAKVFEKYLERAKKNIETAVTSGVTNNVAKKILSGLVKYVKSREGYFVSRLDESLISVRTNLDRPDGHDDLIRLVVSRSEIDLAAIMDNYKSTHKTKTLDQAISEAKAAITGDYQASLLALIGS